MDFHYLLIVVTAIAGKIDGAVILEDQKCAWSSECPTGSCCRLTNGTLLIYSGIFDHVGPFDEEINGHCVPLVAQYNEQCSDTCPCDDTKGLTCFRSVLFDNTIAPFRCQDKSYVQVETDKFMDCFHNPKCQLPLQHVQN